MNRKHHQICFVEQQKSPPLLQVIYGEAKNNRKQQKRTPSVAVSVFRMFDQIKWIITLFYHCRGHIWRHQNRCRDGIYSYDVGCSEVEWTMHIYLYDGPNMPKSFTSDILKYILLRCSFWSSNWHINILPCHRTSASWYTISIINILASCVWDE